jgi:hypothetical protein
VARGGVEPPTFRSSEDRSYVNRRGSDLRERAGLALTGRLLGTTWAQPPGAARGLSPMVGQEARCWSAAVSGDGKGRGRTDRQRKEVSARASWMGFSSAM